jgi:hypothetical protein
MSVFGAIKMIGEEEVVAYFKEEVVAYFKAISRPSAGWAKEN